MNIREFDPNMGQAFQGDVSIIPIPADIELSARAEEIAPINGRLILQEGEVTGHHHAIHLRQRNFYQAPERVADPSVATRSPKLRRALGGAGKKADAEPTARMYRDASVPNELLRRRIITRTDLVVATLVVEGGPMTVTHEEHDGIRLPPGKYLIGRQVESAGAEERVVAD